MDPGAFCCFYLKALLFSVKSNFNIEKLIEEEQIKESNEEDNLEFDALTKTHELAYGVGHFLNDLTATGWINYMLIYLSNINPISATAAAANAG